MWQGIRVVTKGEADFMKMVTRGIVVEVQVYFFKLSFLSSPLIFS